MKKRKQVKKKKKIPRTQSEAQVGIPETSDVHSKSIGKLDIRDLKNEFVTQKNGLCLRKYQVTAHEQSTEYVSLQDASRYAPPRTRAS